MNIKSQLDANIKNIFANPYLFDEGPTVSSFAFLFEGLPGAGAALFGVAPGVARYVERLPFEARGQGQGQGQGLRIRGQGPDCGPRAAGRGCKAPRKSFTSAVINGRVNKTQGEE